jgi:hypothetical protein
MIQTEKLRAWQKRTNLQTLDIFPAPFFTRYPNPFVISTVGLAVAVKNQLEYTLKTSLKYQMGRILATFLGYRSEPYICYMHKGGN